MVASLLWVLSFIEEGDKADVAIMLTPGREQCIFIVLPAAPGDVSLLLPEVFLLPSPRVVQCTPMVSPGSAMVWPRRVLLVFKQIRVFCLQLFS